MTTVVCEGGLSPQARDIFSVQSDDGGVQNVKKINLNYMDTCEPSQNPHLYLFITQPRVLFIPRGEPK